ncbi:DUF6341 family protein [Luteirhabdus pelagi]|uniref:DUF6341 family protein n=1 Tax=Luteirhabdus pelagi TaxID=2792783 RepID=UPI001939281D|nr:uracil phosphoribosyltransferase [Luteirhabdus pelagi]MCT8339371.1 uracil phosphoribosyltransferase [Thermobacterium salinum]
MEWKDIFYGIQDLFEDFLFIPYDALRSWELDSWWGANIMSWLFMIIGFVAFVYWMRKLKDFNDNNEEDRSQTSHSFLG